MLGLAPFSSGRQRQHSGSKQVKAGPPVHRALHQFEPVDLPLSLAVAPRQRQRGLHGGKILDKTLANPATAVIPHALASSIQAGNNSFWR
jgi:hypothetical protein